MGRNPLTSSERKGILAVALVAFLVTGGGLCLTRCGRTSSPSAPEEIEVLVRGDNQGDQDECATGDTVYGRCAGERNTGKVNSGTQKGNKKRVEKARKEYRKRSFLDEPV